MSKLAQFLPDLLSRFEGLYPITSNSLSTLMLNSGLKHEYLFINSMLSLLFERLILNKTKGMLAVT